MEQIDLESEGIVIICLGPVELFVCQPHCDSIVDDIEHENEDQIDTSPSEGDEQTPVPPYCLVVQS